MPTSAIYDAFRSRNCTEISVLVELAIPKATIARLKTAGGAAKPPKTVRGRSKSTLRFATIEGEGKHKIALAAWLNRSGKNYNLWIRCFLVEVDPPPGMFGRFDDLVGLLKNLFGTREVDVSAAFTFNTNEVISVFKPIDLADHSQIFDEITGVTGIKKDGTGKVLYKMEISIDVKQIKHDVEFRQAVELDKKSMPIALLETASKISSLAIKSKGNS